MDQLARKFGDDYEIKLLNLIIGKKRRIDNQWIREYFFGIKIMPVIEAKYFFAAEAKDIVNTIKYFTKKSNIIPYYDTIINYVFSKPDVSDAYKRRFKNYLEGVEQVYIDDVKYIKESTKHFIQTQRLIAARNWLNEVIKNEQYEKFDDITGVFRRATDVKIKRKIPTLFVKGDHTDLDEQSRKPIPTPDAVLNEIMSGGLSRGEFALIGAGLKVGKTTIASLFANKISEAGYTVLQLFFEDTEPQVKVKHRGVMSGVNLSDILKRKKISRVKRKSDSVLEKMEKNGGKLILHKMDTTETKVSDIRQLIEEINQIGVYDPRLDKRVQATIDVVFIDYLDVIQPEKKYKQEWEGQKEVARDIEKLCSADELNFACWAFTQGGRSSLNTEVMEIADIGGDIRKLQIAHFFMTISKTNEQRRDGLANILIGGSRFGQAGILLKNCLFDNGRMQIEFGEQTDISEIEMDENGRIIEADSTNDSE